MSCVVRTNRGSEAEEHTAGTLRDVMARVNCERFILTPDVVIDEVVRGGRSHPVMTLGTGFPHEGALISTFIHEQMHWWSLMCPGSVDERGTRVEAELLERFGSLPEEPPEGAGSMESNLIHLHVCWLELEALTILFGDEWALQRARRQPSYKAIRGAVIEDRTYLGQLFDTNDLGLPPARES